MMPRLKFEKKETLSRKEAAARLTEIAQALGAGEQFELKREGEKLEFDVPNKVMFELEIEVEDGKTELEVEIKWSTQAPAASPAKSRSLSAATRSGPFDRAALAAERRGTRQRRVGD
ncbi:MAG TPA: amphi-Trp domain-containing protein [Trebonia sp.]|jgi:amphi-Trp domain-containing protein|nr:amphi-Trp domain-containing protein [Trebonia sp.]